MLPKIQKQFKSLVILSALLSAAFPILPVKSQTTDISQQPLQINSSQPKKLSQANLVAEDVKPSVVRVVVGCKAKVYSPINGKIYDLETITGHGSGFFVNPNGYIATNAHVTNTENCQQVFQKDLAAKLEADGQTLEHRSSRTNFVRFSR